MAAVSGWRSATTACLNESQWERLFRPNRTTFHLCPFHSFLSVPAEPLTMKPARSTRISLARNCDRFLHTYRIPQAVPRILAIPRASRASQCRKKTLRPASKRMGEKQKRQRQSGPTRTFHGSIQKAVGMRTILYRVSLFLLFDTIGRFPSNASLSVLNVPLER